LIITPKDGGVVVSFKAVPKSSKNSIEYFGDGLKIKLKSPPVDGKANKELISYLSKFLGLKKCDVKIASGDTSKTKSVWIRIDKNELIKKLEEING
jgi:uncharacterized protein (TIGR00251 family)